MSAAIASSVVAIVSLVVATIIYRWQKLIDRETLIQSEVRQLCGEYLTAVKFSFLDQPFIDEPDAEQKARDFAGFGPNERRAYEVRDRLSLIASDELHNELTQTDQAFRHWKIVFTSPEEHGNAEAHRELVKASADQLHARLESLRQVMKKEVKVKSRVGLADVVFALIGKAT